MYGVIILDKLMGCEVASWRWCPTMDLLALANEEPALALHRLSWQRLYSVGLNHSVCSLAWRPDGNLFFKLKLLSQITLGKILCVAHDDGQLSLCDVEKGSVFDTQAELNCSHNCTVTCLQWQQFLPPSFAPHSVVNYRSDKASSLFPAQEHPHVNTPFSLLLSGDKEGTIAIR